MAEEKIKLTEVLEACLDFKRDPTAQNEMAIKKYIDRFIIKEYIPLSEKIVQIALIMGNISSEKLDQFEAESWLAIGKVVYGIMYYVDNLENNLDKLSMSAPVVDLLYEMGVIDEVLKHCEKDYIRFEKMLDETMNFSNIFRIVETTSLYNSDNIADLVKEILEFKKILTPEMLADLKSIANSADPAFTALKETVVDSALNKVLDVDSKELEQASKPEEQKEENKEGENNKA